MSRRGLAWVLAALCAVLPLLAPAGQVRPDPLPRLRIQGNRLLRADTGEAVVLKGVSLFYRKTAGAPGNDLLALVRANLERNERLGIRSNLLRLSYYSHEIGPSDFGKFAELADHLAGSGCYLVLTPHNVQLDAEGAYVPSTSDGLKVNPAYYLPGPVDVSVLKALAGRLSPCTNVIYGLWNEPAGSGAAQGRPDRSLKSASRSQ